MTDEERCRAMYAAIAEALSGLMGGNKLLAIRVTALVHGEKYGMLPIAVESAVNPWFLSRLDKIGRLSIAMGTKVVKKRKVQ